MCGSYDVTFPTGFSLDSHSKENDWSYLYTNKRLGDFQLSFDVEFQSVFKEFQIAFKHKSIFDRLRFRIIDNQLLAFEIVEQGIFYNQFKTTPFSYQLNRKYNIALVICNYEYSIYIDNEWKLTIQDNCRNFKDGGIAFVCWEPSFPSNIKCNVSNVSLELL